MDTGSVKWHHDLGWVYDKEKDKFSVVATLPSSINVLNQGISSKVVCLFLSLYQLTLSLNLLSLNLLSLSHDLQSDETLGQQ